jgi:hypothetical protein
MCLGIRVQGLGFAPCVLASLHQPRRADALKCETPAHTCMHACTHAHVSPIPQHLQAFVHIICIDLTKSPVVRCGKCSTQLPLGLQRLKQFAVRHCLHRILVNHGIGCFGVFADHPKARVDDVLLTTFQRLLLECSTVQCTGCRGMVWG